MHGDNIAHRRCSEFYGQLQVNAQEIRNYSETHSGTAS